jgi:hypothetical protein
VLPINPEQVEAEYDAGDVHDGVDGANFVELDLLGAGAVDLGFHIGQARKDGGAPLQHRGWQRSRLQDAQHLTEPTMRLVRLFEHHPGARAVDAALLDAVGVEAPAFNRQKC